MVVQSAPKACWIPTTGSSWGAAPSNISAGRRSGTCVRGSNIGPGATARGSGSRRPVPGGVGWVPMKGWRYGLWESDPHKLGYNPASYGYIHALKSVSFDWFVKCLDYIHWRKKVWDSERVGFDTFACKKQVPAFEYGRMDCHWGALMLGCFSALLQLYSTDWRQLAVWSGKVG